MTPWIDVLGWTLVHFLWQGALIALVTAAALRLLRGASPQRRYVLACVTLLAMLAAPIVTAHLLSAPAAPAFAASIGPMAGDGVTPAPPRASEALASANVDADTARTRVATMLPFVVAVWLAGVTCFLVRLGGGWWRVRQLHRGARAEAPSTWNAVCVRIARRLGLRGRVHLVDSRLVDTPTVLGWMTPVILLPIAALSNLTPVQVEAILAHELAHVRRRDFVVNLLQTLAETLLFYHPAVWWVSARMRAEREHCCDDVAVAVSGDAVGYAEALAELDAWRTQRERLALGATSGALLDRVRRVLRIPTDDTRPFTGAVTTAVLVLGFVGTAGGLQHLTALRAQLPPPADPVDWQVFQTVHLDIHHMPELEVDRVSREADRAYEQISESFRHAPASRPRLILFTTRAELERALASGVMWASNDSGQRILLSVDVPSGRLRGDLVHELTHWFLFDILPRSAAPPRWITEGLAEYERGEWDAGDLARLGDTISANAVPRISTLGSSAFPGNPRLHYSLGHAAFDFIESRWGKDGMRQFLFALRQNALARSLESPYTAAFGLAPAEFDQGFEAYVRQRFAAQR